MSVITFRLSALNVEFSALQTLIILPIFFNPRFASFLEGVVPNSPRSNYFLTLDSTLKTHMKYMMNFTYYFTS